jgi:hypothetical protein
MNTPVFAIHLLPTQSAACLQDRSPKKNQVLDPEPSVPFIIARFSLFFLL